MMCGTTTTNTNELSLTEKSGNSCACCATSNSGAADASESAAVTSEYRVTGMTCGHCVSSVTEELAAMSGVNSVSVDLDAGGTSRVTVGSSAELDLDAVRTAVAEAGYTLVSSAP